MDKNIVASDVHAKLLAAEASIDQAMFDATKLLESFVQAHRDLNLPLFAGETAQSRLVETVSCVAEAHKTIRAAHGSLYDLGRKLDLEVTGELTSPTLSKADAAQPVAELRVAS